MPLPVLYEVIAFEQVPGGAYFDVELGSQTFEGYFPRDAARAYAQTLVDADIQALHRLKITCEGKASQWTWVETCVEEGPGCKQSEPGESCYMLGCIAEVGSCPAETFIDIRIGAFLC
jgi:hypothetical protein